LLDIDADALGYYVETFSNTEFAGGINWHKAIPVNKEVEMSSTTLTAWPLLLWNTLKEKGVDPSLCFDKVMDVPLKMRDSQARFDTELMSELWESAVELTGDSEIGVAVGKSWNPTTFHALGFAWLASNFLLEALERLVRYAHIVNNALEIEIEKRGKEYRLSLVISDESYRSQGHPAGNDAAVAAVITMIRLLVGEDFKPLAMELMRPKRESKAMKEFSGVSPKYNQPTNVMYLDAEIVERELGSGNSRLVEANEQVAREYLEWLNKDDVVSAVKVKVAELMPSGQITEQKVAERINMNVRTMQRRLKENNQNFKMIVNDTRREIVRNYIYNSQVSLTEITYLLGFADQANFTRAFKRWTGLAPSAFRNFWGEKMVNTEIQAK